MEDCNLRLGPTAWQFQAALGIEANDNIQLEEVSPQADVIFHPQLGGRMLWRVSELNSLTFALGVGYSAYVAHPAYGRFFIAPGSELSFDLYAGDFWVNFHDRCSISENSYQDPTVVGTADYSQLINAVGESTTWDLNHLLVSLGYDHVNYVWLQGDQTAGAQPSGHSEVLAGSVGYVLRPGLSAGLELGGSLVHYSSTSNGQPYSDATQWNVGGFVDGQISQYLHARASAGYTVYTPWTSDSLGDFLAFSGVYAQLELGHNLNRYVSYTLGGGRTLNFAFYGGTIDLYFARWQADWKLLRRITLATSFAFEHGTQLITGAETFNRFGPAISLGRALAEKLTASLGYQFYLRCSDLPGRDYTVNIVSLNLTYKL